MYQDYPKTLRVIGFEDLDHEFDRRVVLSH